MVESGAATDGILVVGSAVIGGVIHSIVIKRNILPKLAVPLDGNYLLLGKPILGRNKTWRGIAVMMVGTIIGVLLLRPHHGGILVGAAIAIGYLLGELPNSFIKRRLNIQPGGKNTSISYLADQSDSAIGIALILLLTRVSSTWQETTVIITLGTLVHILFDQLLYGLRVKH